MHRETVSRSQELPQTEFRRRGNIFREDKRSPEYYRKEADTLSLLANSTCDRATCLVLLSMADDHLRLAEAAMPAFMMQARTGHANTPSGWACEVTAHLHRKREYGRLGGSSHQGAHASENQ